MPHLAISCPPLPGHINPFCVLGRELIKRGHQVTLFSFIDAEPMVRGQGLGFCALAEEQCPAGSLQPMLAALREQQGFRSTLYAIQAAGRLLHLILETAPAALRTEGIDAVLADQNEPAMASAAEHLGVPFASICTSLPINREPAIPPSFSPWSYTNSIFGRLRNKAGYAVSDYLTRNLQAILNQYRSRWQLKMLRSPDDSFSTLAQVAQMPIEFDFPRKTVSAAMHYTGPWFDDTFRNLPTYSEFPFDKLDGRPLLYVSFGTLQSSNSKQFEIIARACIGLDLQVVIATGAKQGAALPELPGNHLVVHHAPQTDLLKRAALTITHGGMNTTMQALHFGCPLIAIPFAHDQPAIAARLRRTGAGLVLSPQELTVERLRTAIDAIRGKDSSWQKHAKRLEQAIAKAGGVEKAADILQQSLFQVRSKTASA